MRYVTIEAKKNMSLTETFKQIVSDVFNNTSYLKTSCHSQTVSYLKKHNLPDNYKVQILGSNIKIPIAYHSLVLDSQNNIVFDSEEDYPPQWKNLTKFTKTIKELKQLSENI